MTGTRESAGGLAPRDAQQGSDRPDLRERFIEHTLANRDDASGRRLLALEWPYIEALLGERLREPLAVLDLACGSGHQTRAWAERGFRVAGYDLDHRLLRAGRDRLRDASAHPESIHWSCGDATSLPFANATFDIVFNNSLLEHVPRWEQVLAETARVLRPRGLFVMYTTNRLCPLQQEVNHFPCYGWLPDPVQRRVLSWIMTRRRDLVNYTDLPAVNWFTFPRMRRAFKDAGFEAYDRLDLLARRAGGGLKRALASGMTRHDLLKLPYQFYAISLALYGVRNDQPSSKC